MKRRKERRRKDIPHLRIRKPKPSGDALRAAGLALPLCLLPEPQPRAVLPDLPGPVPDWFGEAKQEPQPIEPPEPKTDEQAEVLEAERIWWVRRNELPLMSDGPRDVRRGDRWLPWH